jgi:hypothetical protein
MFEEKTMLTRLFALIAQLWHLLTHPEYARYLQFNSAGDAFILMNANEVRLSLPHGPSCACSPSTQADLMLPSFRQFAIKGPLSPSSAYASFRKRLLHLTLSHSSHLHAVPVDPQSCLASSGSLPSSVWPSSLSALAYSD